MALCTHHEFVRASDLNDVFILASPIDDRFRLSHHSILVLSTISWRHLLLARDALSSKSVIVPNACQTRVGLDLGDAASAHPYKAILILYWQLT